MSKTPHSHTGKELGFKAVGSNQSTLMIDFCLLGIIALSFSGIQNIIPCGTFGQTWIERCVDLIVAAYVLSKPKFFATARPFFWPAIWMILYFVVGYNLAASPHIVTTSLMQAVLIYMPLLLFVGLALGSRRQWERLAAILQIVAIGACAISVAQLLSPYVWDITTSVNGLDVSTKFTDTTRAPALWMNPNQAAFCFFFPFVMSLWCPIRWLAWFGRLAALIGVMLTTSRGGLLIMTAFIISYMCCSLILIIKKKMAKPSLNARTLVGLLGVGVIIGAVIWTMSSQKIDLLNISSEQITKRFESDNVTRGAETREFLATYWLEKALDGPWYGQGLCSFQVGSGRAETGCHNQFIMVYGELGILGFISYVVLLCAGIRDAWTMRLHPRDRLILFLTWGVFLFWHFKSHSMFDGRESFVIWGLLFMAPHALQERPLMNQCRDMRLNFRVRQ
jgi:O-antigen ligase